MDLIRNLWRVAIEKKWDASQTQTTSTHSLILIENSLEDHDLIRRSYKFSKSIYLRWVNLIKNQKYSSNLSTWFSKRGIEVEESTRKLILNMLELPKYPITINKIQTSIKNKIGCLYNPTILKKLIKWELKCLYKRVALDMYNIKLIELYLSKDCFVLSYWS